jgi:hypothetical protein
MVFIPAVLAFGVKITAPSIGLGAVIAMLMDCSVQIRLRLFDGVLAPRSVIGVGWRRRCYKHEQRSRYYCHDCTFSNSLHQGFLLSFLLLDGGAWPTCGNLSRTRLRDCGRLVP